MRSHHPVELPQQPLHPEGAITEPDRTYSRRRFLSFVGAAAATFAAKELRDSSVSWALLAPDAEDIPSEIPQELQGEAINYKNEHYQGDSVQLVSDAIDAYKQEGGQPFYERPPYYFSQADMLGTVVRSATDLDKVRDVLSEPGTRFQKNILFSRMPYSTVTDLVDFDPGSTAKQHAERAIEALEGDGGAPGIAGQADITERDVAIAQAFSEVFEETKAYIDTLRKKRLGEPVSTRELLTYYLRQNEGDITTSLLDTTLFVKMAARVDIKKLSSIAAGTYDNATDYPYGRGSSIKGEPEDISKASYEGAQFIANRFYDDFAEELPLDEVLRHVPAKSDLNNFEYDSGDIHPRDAKYKDFDPVNRAGLAYHSWNLLFLCASADPTAVKKLTAAYYANELGRKDHGRVKVAADLHVAEQAFDVRAVFDQYKR